MNKDNIEQLEKLGRKCWLVVHVLFGLSVISLFLIPAEWNEGIRIAFWCVAYSTELPVILGHPLIYAEKKGWLTD